MPLRLARFDELSLNADVGFRTRFQQEQLGTRIDMSDHIVSAGGVGTGTHVEEGGHLRGGTDVDSI